MTRKKANPQKARRAGTSFRNQGLSRGALIQELRHRGYGPGSQGFNKALAAYDNAGRNIER